MSSRDATTTKTRRQFLRGLGGTTLAIPFLPSLTPRSAEAQLAKPPLRFAMALGHYGRYRKHWYPTFADAQLTQSDGVLHGKLTDIEGPLSYILGPAFDPVRKKISVLHGLDSTRALAGHNSSLPTTGCSESPSSPSGFGYSIDCVLEESSKFYPQPPLLGALRTNPFTSSAGLYRAFSSWSFTSKARVGQRLPPEWSPHAVYDKYFNQANFQAAQDRNARIRGVSTLVNEDFRAVMNGPRIGAADKRRLDNYMTLMAQLDKVLAKKPMACARGSAPAPALSTAEELHGAMFDLEVAALACGHTKIAMHSLWHWRNELSANPEEHHSSCHGPWKTAPGETMGQAGIFNRFTLGMVAGFMKRLDAVVEADGSTLLDNTLFIYANEDGSGAHEHLDLPVIVAGGQGKLRTGHYIDFRPRPLRKVNAEVMLGRPYNALLVTAFKALGLTEAEYQRFGQTGFGRYDGSAVAHQSHYLPFTGARANDPLPFLYAG